jgi:hypothetical protein
MILSASTSLFPVNYLSKLPRFKMLEVLGTKPRDSCIGDNLRPESLVDTLPL